jgi:hypothetical protein
MLNHAFLRGVLRTLSVFTVFVSVAWLAQGQTNSGYADNTTEVALCQTLVTDMENHFTTLYLRREFESPVAIDSIQRLLFTMDWDDGAALLDQRYSYRIRVTNDIGLSRWSNLAAATRARPSLFVGGVLTSNTTWSPELGTVYVLTNVTVSNHITLTIEAGTVVNLTNNVLLTASTGGVIRIRGNWDKRVFLQRWNGTNNWGALRADGTNAFLDVHFADISGGQSTVYYDATALLEDSYFPDFHQQDETTLFHFNWDLTAPVWPPTDYSPCRLSLRLT